jgi:ComF family protein
VVDEAGGLCAKCWPEVEFIAAPRCDCCGSPFPYEADDGLICGSCHERPPHWRKARSVFRYSGQSRKLVLAFKHGDRTDAAPGFARWMQRAGSDILTDVDLLVPVPLHRWRLFLRRYNQAALLANELGRSTGIKVIPDLLLRTRRTTSQGQLGRGEREGNVKNAFKVRSARRNALENKAVLLIDDVLTSGATANECAKTLVAGGAKSVDVLTLARVV